MNEDGNASALLGLSNAEKRARNLGKRISTEAEAWKVAQIAATLCVAACAAGGRSATADHADFVREARGLLAESRRQAAASAGERDDG